MARNTLRAGAAQVEITPPLGTLINGEFTSRYATDIADPLYAKALVLQDSQMTLVLVIVDICAMQRDLLDEIKERIQAELRILPAQTLIASTHTHAAGSVADLLMTPVDWAYRLRLPNLVLNAVKQAFQGMVEAQVAFGSAHVPEHVVCRRYRMRQGYKALNPVTGTLDDVKTNPFGDEEAIVGRAAEVDTEVAYLAVKTIDNQWISLIANYSLHYVGDCERGTISADYFGYFSRELKQMFNTGQSFVAMMSNGTSGDVNIWDFMNTNRYPEGNHEKSQLIGKDIAGAVYRSLENVNWETSASLACGYEDVSIRSRKANAQELRKALVIVRQTDYENLSLDLSGIISIYAREQVLLSNFPDVVPFPIQAFRIGSGVIGALGGEFFAETGLQLKKECQGNYFTICLANDYVGYVPPLHELEKGGYETWRCRTSRLQGQAEALISERLQTIISSL
ncbi:neutral/alkaline non-lysosomal ceramidase N-terminal domain-containing protein [Olivibacter sp. SDN3]|uniref:neutral/alkaline non-lysosomal ceramidase N-terminal domain-containing protein n=1 Tax=Olivibacter sp. SDN3 TaxID=2764720 RepID=UPI001651692F|nr:neutral/alkaline non-lysosomal ceramidase N-terminal domain-containing protein [Olivibacter sp. SDN3]QNL51550.1 neutral/alkaline non-lysosomal ceramidase N-terminal domain-containing protein [Olivibacter sp. SDN3]